MFTFELLYKFNITIKCTLIYNIRNKNNTEMDNILQQNFEIYQLTTMTRCVFFLLTLYQAEKMIKTFHVNVAFIK